MANVWHLEGGREPGPTSNHACTQSIPNYSKCAASQYCEAYMQFVLLAWFERWADPGLW